MKHNEQEIKAMVKKAYSAATPDVLESVLSDCKKLKGRVTPMKKKNYLKSIIAAAAAVVFVLAGVIGEVDDRLFQARRVDEDIGRFAIDGELDVFLLEVRAQDLANFFSDLADVHTLYSGGGVFLDMAQRDEVVHKVVQAFRLRKRDLQEVLAHGERHVGIHHKLSITADRR